MTFNVQKKQCATCIYHPSSPLDLAKLEAQCKDRYGYFEKYRTCHHSVALCCRGFWNKHRDDFAAGQIAQRLGLVRFVSEDVLNVRKEKS